MIKSKDLAAMPYCFSLDYHMYGKGSGALEILAQEKDKAQILSENNIVKNQNENIEEEFDNDADEESNDLGTRSLKKITGDHKDTWHNLQLNYRPTNESLQVRLAVGASDSEVVQIIQFGTFKTIHFT